MSDFKHISDEDLTKALVEIGGNVKAYRTEVLKISIEKFSELAGLSSRTISRIESGDGNISMSSFCKVMILMGNEVLLLDASKPKAEAISSLLKGAEDTMHSKVNWDNE